MLQKFFSSEFSRNVATLVTGTAIAQAIPIAISPILTRLYTPEDFGIFAFYISIAAVISVVATGRYEFAITLPPKDSDAFQIVWLSSILVFSVAIIAFLSILIFHNQIVSILNNEQIGGWLYFIPLTILFSGLYNIFNYWFNRKRAYSKLSRTRVVQTSSTNAINLGVGFVSKLGPFGLIVGNIVGQLIAVSYFFYSFFYTPLQYSRKFDKPKVIALAKRYKDFPKYDTWASFFNISSNQLTHVFFNTFFNAVISGNFYLVQKIFNLPITLLAGAVQDVFKMEVVDLHIAKGNTRRLFFKILRRLFLLSIIPSILIYFFAENAFSFVFGKEWGVAGTYVKIMTPVFFLRFLSFPLSYMFYVVEKQKYNTVGQFVLVVSILITFLIGKDYEPETVVKMLSAVYSVFYLTYLYISYSLTSKGELIT